MIIKSKVGEIIKALRADNKVINLSDEIVNQISQDLDQEMNDFRREFARKEEISKRETARVILNS